MGAAGTAAEAAGVEVAAEDVLLAEQDDPKRRKA